MGWCCKWETCQSAVAYHLVQRLLRNKNVDFIEFLLFFSLELQKLESQWTVPQIIHSLLINSGMLDDAENYLQHGTGLILQ